MEHEKRECDIVKCPIHKTAMIQVLKGGRVWCAGFVQLDEEPERYECGQCKAADLQRRIDTITTIDRIDSLCYQSFPCQHRIETDIGSLFLSGTNIARLQKKLNNDVDPHFQKYIK